MLGRSPASRRSWQPRRKIAFIVVALMAAISLVASISAIGCSTSKRREAVTQLTATPQSSATSSWATAAVTDETVTEALKSMTQTMANSAVKGNVEEVFVDREPADFTDPSAIPLVTVSFETGKVVTDTDMLTVVGDSFVDTAALLFQNPGVGSILLNAKADVRVQSGELVKTVAASLEISRATAAKIDWGALRDLEAADNKQIFCIADGYRIHVTIYSMLKDTGCLTGDIKP